MALVLPTETEIKTQIQNAANLLNEHRKWLASNTPNFVSLEDTLIQSIEGPNSDRAISAVAAIRRLESDALKSGRDLLLPLLETYCQIAARPVAAGNSDQVFDALYDYYIDGTKSVKSRAFTFASPSAGGSNTGTGTLNRLTKDENNHDLEAQTPDAKVATVLADYRNGREQGKELWEIRGGAALLDGSWTQIDGSGKVSTLEGLTGTDSERFIANPSFSQFSGTVGSPTLTGWTQSGTFQLDSTNYYRKLRGESTSYALRFDANGYVEQSLDDRKVNVNPRVPIYCQVVYNRQVGSGDGTLTLTLGNKTANVVLAAQTGWNVLRIALDDDCWFKNWNKNSALVKIDLASRTTGYVLVDDVIIAPFQSFDGGWYAPVGGATAFLRGDKFTWTDTATDSILQRLFWLYFGRHLPHNGAGAETWADPS